MKGIRLYADYGTNVAKRRKITPTNCIALYLAIPAYWSGTQYLRECVTAVYDQPNSPCASSGVSLNYLTSNCRRISEARARELHPRLFDVLDAPE